MKKILLVLFMTIIFIQSANAAGIGYVDYYKVMENYSLAKTYKKQLKTKYNAFTNYMKQQENAIKKAKTDEQKKAIGQKALAEVEKKQQEYIDFKAVKEKEVIEKVKIVAENVRKQKGLDVIIKSDAHVVGGVDCTQDVINGLK